MKQPVYINAAACISPQQTFGSVELPPETMLYDGERMKAIEPDYKVYLNIPAARRMTRMIKMGVCAALKCLEDAEVKNPDAIIAGTGLGCLEDSEKFLASMIDGNEQTLSPTSFIFSTHNTVAAQIALLLKCNNYNFTHTHRGLSFENTLLDSLLFLSENPHANVLAGAVDEVTDTSFTILKRLEKVKEKENTLNSALTVAGEGAAFFSLDSLKKQGLASIAGLEVFSFPASNEEVLERVSDFCRRNSVDNNDIVFTGRTGDADRSYDSVIAASFPGNPLYSYKQLCGEYHTSTAFACWLGAMVLKTQVLPGYLFERSEKPVVAERIVIINHYKSREYSLLLLERC